MKDISSGQVPHFIRELMPKASEDELTAAAETFRGYIAIVLRIYERRQLEKASHDSTEPSRTDIMHVKRRV